MYLFVDLLCIENNVCLCVCQCHLPSEQTGAARVQPLWQIHDQAPHQWRSQEGNGGHVTISAKHNRGGNKALCLQPPTENDPLLDPLSVERVRHHPVSYWVSAPSVTHWDQLPLCAQSGETVLLQEAMLLSGDSWWRRCGMAPLTAQCCLCPCVWSVR